MIETVSNHDEQAGGDDACASAGMWSWRSASAPAPVLHVELGDDLECFHSPCFGDLAMELP